MQPKYHSLCQLLSKLNSKDNADFGRDMLKEKKDEDVHNLIEWLQREANLRSRGKQEHKQSKRYKRNPRQPAKRVEVSTSTTSTASNEDEQQCINGCTTNHPLHSCSVYRDLIVDQRWQKVKRNKLCRKCLKRHHTDDCKIPDGSS